MVHFVRRPAAAAVLLALLLGPLTACSSGSSTTAEPPSRTPSPSPTAPTPPPLPAAARAHTKAGAVAFVRHYIDLINYALSTGDTAEIDASSGPDCASCKRSNRFVRQLYLGHGRFIGGQTRIVRVLDALPTDPALGDYVVDVEIHVEPSVVRRPGRRPKRNQGGQNILSMFPKWQRHEWTVAQWSRAQ